MKKITQGMLLSAFCALGGNSWADDNYNAEFSGAFTLDGSFENEVIIRSGDDKRVTDSGGSSFSGQYYFGGVDTSNGPLAEAAYIERASSIYASYGDPWADSILDVQEVRYGTTIAVSSLVFNLEVNERDINDDSATNYTLGTGVYVGKNTLLSIEYHDNEVYWAGPRVQLDDNEEWQLRSRWLAMAEEGSSLALEVSAGHIRFNDASEGTSMSLGVSVYPHDKVGINLLTSRLKSDDVDYAKLTASIKWFIIDEVALSVTYEDDETDDALPTNLNIKTSSKRLFLGATVRL